MFNTIVGFLTKDCIRKLICNLTGKDDVLCRYGAYKPDFAFYHTINFAVSASVTAAVVVDHDDSTDDRMSIMVVLEKMKLWNF